MHIKSYAKINLGLHIVGKRQDGFHDIDTVFHHIDLFDDITIERSPAIHVSCSDPSIPSNAENLCWKAAELVRRRCGLSDGVRIDIHKNIPSGAGLGGGSSNAAAILLSMPELFGCSIERSELASMALTLGSDVPFFLQPESAFGGGRGELLTYFPLALPFWILLVNPRIHVSTPWAYRAVSQKQGGIFPARKKLQELFSAGPGLPPLTNDFEEEVFAAFPAVRTIKETMLNAGAVQSLMSGSGSSVFGLFETEEQARRAAAAFDKSHFIHLTKPNFVLR